MGYVEKEELTSGGLGLLQKVRLKYRIQFTFNGITLIHTPWTIPYRRDVHFHQQSKHNGSSSGTLNLFNKVGRIKKTCTWGLLTKERTG